MILGQLKDDPYYTDISKRCFDYLLREQEPDGSWFGRWGTNYIYGTWSVLIAFECYGVDREHPAVRRAVNWLYSMQRPDGGWGEDNQSYHDPGYSGKADKSTGFQTAWALLALMAAGESNSKSVRMGVEYLIQHQQDDGLWSDPEFTAPGFPRVFYLKYHGYNKYFPLWALSRYRNEVSLKNISQN
jgi:squalene-hopene/tetraprenyl-beta-curcumene cyclase